MNINNQSEHSFIDSQKLLGESLKFEILYSYFHSLSPDKGHVE